MHRDEGIRSALGSERGGTVLRACFAIFAVVYGGLPAYAEVTPELEYGLSIRAQIARAKQYPPGAKARHEIGQTFIKLTIDATGRLVGSETVKPSCFNELNQAALSAVGRAQPFSPFPQTISQRQLTFTLPVVFAFSLQEALVVQVKADCNNPVKPAPTPSKPSPLLLSSPPS